MKTGKLPRTDSIQELARFWQQHDLTDFGDELEEAVEHVFAGGDSVHVRLRSRDARTVRRLAESKGVSEAQSTHGWVVQKLGRPKRAGQTKGPT